MECPHCGNNDPQNPIQCAQCDHSLLSSYQCQNPSCLRLQDAHEHCRSCKTQLTGPLSGQTLRWNQHDLHIREWLGGGGMGAVYRAIEENEQHQCRAVALKLNKEVTNQTLRDRFHREVKILTKLKSPHHMKVYGYGEHKQNNILIAQFMIAEILEGITLQQQLEQGPLPPNLALTIFRQLANALAEAHEIGIIHRDLKPNNIMLLHDPHQQTFVKLFDFGLSKDTQNSKELSSSGIILGTLSYMSPEQAKGEHIDQRSDIFSLGVILYQMLTGALPFPAENLYQIYQQHAQGPQPLPSSFSQPFQEFLQRCLAYQPSQRHPNLKACLHALTTIEQPHASRPKQAPSQPSSFLPPPVIFALCAIAIVSLSLAYTFHQRTLHALSLPDPTPSQHRPPPKQTRGTVTQRRIPPRKAPKDRQRKPLTAPPQRNPSSKRSKQPTRKRPSKQPTRKRPARKRPSKRPKKRQPTPRKPSRVKVILDATPPCQRLLIHSNKKKRSIKQPYAPFSLAPGKVQFLCINNSLRLRRRFSVQLQATPSIQRIQKRWTPITVTFRFSPWAHLYIDQFFIKRCQHGCRAFTLWSGTSQLVLKRDIKGTTGRAIVHKRTIHVHPNMKTLIKIRWK